MQSSPTATPLPPPIFLSVVYLLLVVYAGPLFMATRPPIRLLWLSRVWNLSLAAFSACGVGACIPTLFSHLVNNGFHYSVCADCYELAGTGAPALWAVLFCLSKLLELFDTVLLVLKKRPLLVLHYFHHSSVIAFAWAAWVYHTPLALWYGSMNFSVHAVMYSYFFATSFDRRVLRVAPIITTLQLSQFAMGTIVNCFAAWAYYFSPRGCAVHPHILYLGGLMYLAYGALFANLFFDRYVRHKPKGASKRAAVDELGEDGWGAPGKRAIRGTGVRSDPLGFGGGGDSLESIKLV